MVEEGCVESVVDRAPISWVAVLSRYRVRKTDVAEDLRRCLYTESAARLLKAQHSAILVQQFAFMCLLSSVVFAEEHTPQCKDVKVYVTQQIIYPISSRDLHLDYLTLLYSASFAVSYT